MRNRRLERLALIGILLLAAYLRLNHLGWTEFKLDEAQLSRLALNLARGVEFPVVGIGSSAGIVNLPLASWLLAIPYAISSSPIVATGFVAGLNVIAVAGCYALTRRWLGASASGAAALIATLLFATAPWAVLHARKLWANNLMAPFVTAWAWSGWLAYVERRPRALIAHALTLAVCIHIHYSALLLLPVSAMWAAAFARRIRLHHAVAAVALFAATFAPFLMADAARGGQATTRLLEVTGQPAQVDGQALYLARLLITGQEIHSLAGPQEYQNWLSSIPAVEALAGSNGPGLNSGLVVLVFVGAALALADVARAARRRALDDRAAASLMMLTWLAVPILLQLRHGLPLFVHYFLFLYPVPFMLVGALYARQFSVRASSQTNFDNRDPSARRAEGVFSIRLRRVGRWGLIAFAALIAGLQAAQSITLQQFVASRSTPGGFGVPLEQLMRVAEEIERASRELDGAEAIIYAEGDNPRAHDGPAALDFLLPPHLSRRIVDLAQGTAVYPQDSTVMAVYSPSGQPLPGALAETAALQGPGSVIALRRGEEPAQVRIQPGHDRTAPPCADDEPLADWENGVTLLGVEAAGEWRHSGGWIELCYRVNRGASEMEYHWFTHVMGPDANRWAQIDAPGYPAHSWRAGDVIVARFGPYVLPANAPAGSYVLRVGIYTFPDVANVPRVGAGISVTDHTEIDLGGLIR